jgi:hypothetical protein
MGKNFWTKNKGPTLAFSLSLSFKKKCLSHFGFRGHASPSFGFVGVGGSSSTTATCVHHVQAYTT